MTTSESIRSVLSLDTLRRFSSEGYEAIPPEDFLEAAEFCREWSVNHADPRFIVLERCFRLSLELWSPGESGAAIASEADALLSIWQRELPTVLDAAADEATILAQHLEEEIRVFVRGAERL